ncbi:exported hypothetical protein [Paraburkholderia piptadeniae]|uniref:Uncharacterized protein n=1 Tax=Paraburkholderia piptadeniae TaxID=1701573 RepID=A0A1N7S0H9_9BURK|nr:exported hypothetical protein [Paraburkholderia piptadeniae]
MTNRVVWLATTPLLLAAVTAYQPFDAAGFNIRAVVRNASTETQAQPQRTGSRSIR